MKRFVVPMVLLCAMMQPLARTQSNGAGPMPKVGDVAPDFKMSYFDGHDMKASHRAILFADRIKIEQSLGRMFMRAIAGVDHTGLEMLRQKLRRTRGTVAQHENICMQRLEITRGVL